MISSQRLPFSRKSVVSERGKNLSGMPFSDRPRESGRFFTRTLFAFPYMQKTI